MLENQTPDSNTQPANLADFDAVGSTSSSPNPIQPAPKPAPKPVNAQQTGKFFLGCFGILATLFLLLVIAMIGGLSAGEETIRSLGFDPAFFKNLTIGFVNTIFGALALGAIVIFLLRLSKRLLSTPDEAAARKLANHGMLASGLIFVAIVAAWSVAYGYLSQFDAQAAAPKLEIVTSPINTLGLTSPVQIQFSAERIKTNFAKAYDIVNYEWDIDGDSKADATGERVTLDFLDKGKKNGIYNVILRVNLQPKSGGELRTEEYEKTVSIAKQEIVGEIVADPASGKYPLTAKLDAAEIYDPDGVAIINYAWDLDGDGRADLDGPTYSRADHTFETIGEHKVSVTVTSADFAENGQHEIKTIEKTISVFEPDDIANAEAIIVADPKSGVAPLIVSFDASESNKINKQKIDRYEWIVGDGTDKFYGVHNKYTFEKPGVYFVTLRVTYFNGQVKTTTTEIKVSDPEFAPTAVIRTVPEQQNRTNAIAGPAPLAVSFDALDSLDKDNNIITYEWDFEGDGSFDEVGSKVAHEYRDEGIYKAKLRVTDADGNASEALVKIIVGSELAVIDFGASALSGPAPFTVDFDASGSRMPGKQIISYEWDFDATKSSRNAQTFIYNRAQTSHIFDSIGEHLVRLTLHAADGTTDSGTLKVIATYSSLSALFTPSRSTGAAPLAVSFSSAASTGNIDRYEWVFNDGKTSTEASPVHIFEKSGVYEVVLKVYDDKGNVASYTRTIEVK